MVGNFLNLQNKKKNLGLHGLKNKVINQRKYLFGNTGKAGLQVMEKVNKSI